MPFVVGIGARENSARQSSAFTYTTDQLLKFPIAKSPIPILPERTKCQSTFPFLQKMTQMAQTEQHQARKKVEEARLAINWLRLDSTSREQWSEKKRKRPKKKTMHPERKRMAKSKMPRIRGTRLWSTRPKLVMLQETHTLPSRRSSISHLGSFLPFPSKLIH